MAPTLNLKGRFEVMKKKLNALISKLMQTDINLFRAATHHNTCIMKSVYFGCGIVELTNKQEDELKIHMENRS